MKFKNKIHSNVERLLVFFIVVFLCCIFNNTLFSQNQIVFNRTYNNFDESGAFGNTAIYGNDYSRTVTVLDDGYIIGGTTDNLLFQAPANSYVKAFYLKINFFGDTIWKREYDDILIATETFSDILSLGDEYLMLGSIGDTLHIFENDYNILLIKIDSNGVVLWQNEYDFGLYEYAREILRFNGGFLILSNRSNFNSLDTFYTNPCLLQIDSTGQEIWSYCYGDTNTNYAASKILLIENEIYIFGAIDDYQSNISFKVTKIDSNGNQLDIFEFENQTYNIRSGGYNSSGYYIDENGIHFIMSGTIELSSTNNAAYLISINENFEKEWERIYDPGLKNELFLSCQVLSDGRIVAISNRNDYENKFPNPNGSTTDECWLVMIDKNGNKIWERFLRAHDVPTSYTYPYQLKTPMDGGFAITGYAINNQIQTNGIFHRNDAWLCKTDSCGFTLGTEPQALFTIDSVVGAQVYISNLSEEYCNALLLIENTATGLIDTVNIYAYSQFTNGNNPEHMIYTVSDTGSYLFELYTYAGDGVDSFSSSILISDTSTSILEVNRQNISFTIFPNPSSNYFILQLNTNEFTTVNNENLLGKIYTLTGQEVHTFQIENKQLQQKIELPELVNGVYTIKIHAVNNDFSGVKRLMVVK
jgi:hypothetical protein